MRHLARLFHAKSLAKCIILQRNERKRRCLRRERGVERYEMGGKVDKNTDPKTHNGHNLARLNDAKCIILCSMFTQMSFEK